MASWQCERPIEMKLTSSKLSHSDILAISHFSYFSSYTNDGTRIQVVHQIAIIYVTIIWYAFSGITRDLLYEEKIIILFIFSNC